MAATPTRGFRLFSALHAKHGPLVRYAAASAAWLTALVFTGRAALAREAAALFAQDDFATGLHRLRWYRHHGWASGKGRTPLFDPATGADAATIVTMLNWLKSDSSLRADLARLYLLAWQIHDATDPAAQTALMDRYTEIAQAHVGDIPAPDFAARAAKGDDFTLTDARTALASLTQALDQRWYIISGTFLGAVREGTFLTHDYDIDIGIDAQDFDEATFLAALRAAPDLTYVNQSAARQLASNANGDWSTCNWPALYRVMHASGVGIDVFIHHKEDGACWHGSGKHRWSNSPFDLADYTIAGLPVLGPADADRYLIENYGNWRVPVTTFNCSTGTPNVAFHRNLSAIAEFLRTAILQGSSADAAVAVLVLQQEGYLDDTLTRFTLPFRD